LSGWAWEVFVEKADLFIAVMEHKWERGRREAEGIARVLERHGVPRGSRVLELGCGIGRVAIPLARLGYRVTCLDFSRPFIDRARERARLEGVEGLATVVGDAFRVDDALAGQVFDAAYMTWSTLLGYRTRRDDLELLRRTARIVRPGGLLVIANTVSRDLVLQRSRCPKPYVSEFGDIIVAEYPEFDPIRSTLKNRWVFYRRSGRNLLYIDEFSFTLRVYTLTELVEMAESVGWRLEGAYHSLETLEPPRPEGSPINAVFKRE